MTGKNTANRQDRVAASLRSFLLLVLALTVVVPTARSENVSTAAGMEFFETKIRPLLIERCYKCHSATSGKLKGGLRLDSFEAMVRGGDTRPAVVPGDPEKSLLIEAVRYGNIDLQMPPKKRLNDAEISDLVSWIKMGAPWPKDPGSNAVAAVTKFDLEKRREQHWSWKKIQATQPPAVGESSWPMSGVDHFILSQLEKSGLSPAPPADKRTLIRRAYFDLIGLPPARGEVEAFLADSSPGAFETVVDRLLASPRFGERWARHWLDLVRYSETLGHEFDFPNFNAWRYRDYVIRAFNSDLPYNQFVVEQIAGDLLKQPRRNAADGSNESAIGTGFFWLGQRVHSPVDVRQEQAEVIDNQIDVTSKAFLGLTVACARCHDHKFDAISTRDYYSLFGVLASSRYTQRSLDPHEALADRIEKLKAVKQELRAALGKAWLGQASKLGEYLMAAREISAESNEAVLSNSVQVVSAAQHLDAKRLAKWVHALRKKEVEKVEPGLLAWMRLASMGGAPGKESFENRVGAVIAELQNSQLKTMTAPGNDAFADFSSRDYSGWTVEDEAFGGGPSPAGEFVAGDSGRPVLAVFSEATANSAAISRRLEGVLRSPTFTVQKRYIHILACGSESRLNVRVDNFTMIREPIYGGLKRILNDESLAWITVDVDTWKGHRAYLEFEDLVTADPSDEAGKEFSPMAYVAVNRVVFSDDPAPPNAANRAPFLSAEQLSTLSGPKQLAKLYQTQTAAAIRAWVSDRKGSGATAAELSWIDWLSRNSLLDGGKAGGPDERRVGVLLAELKKIEATIPSHNRAVGMAEGTGLDENVFIRGSHKTLGETVPRRFLEALGGSEKTRFTQGSGRFELAQCMVSPSNPFLARVMVNRIWLHLFGRGIVPTPDDFGALGQPPTNPELLDWLANWYSTEGGWSNKKLIRMLVTSRTYGMSSRPSDTVAEEKDPQNVMLHRMPVRRLEYEPIRDTLLAVSGQLDLKMFGPPVPVYLTEFMEGRGRPTQSGPIDGAGRRSIYQDVRRNFLAPMMRAFDFPVPSTTVGRRTASNVPAQSLILMNDPFVIGQAGFWAKSLIAQQDRTTEQRIVEMYQTLLSRAPLPSELDRAKAFLDRQGEAYGLSPAERGSNQALWADLCQVFMNLKEFIFVN